MKNTKRGEIYYADLSPVIGSEQNGTRLALILQKDVKTEFGKYSSQYAFTELRSCCK